MRIIFTTGLVAFSVFCMVPKFAHADLFWSMSVEPGRVKVATEFERSFGLSGDVYCVNVLFDDKVIESRCGLELTEANLESIKINDVISASAAAGKSMTIRNWRGFKGYFFMNK